MSNLKGWLQGLGGNKKEEEDKTKKESNQTLSSQEKIDDDPARINEKHAKKDISEEDVVSTHVSSASGQFLNMTAMVLDAVPEPEPETFDKSQKPFPGELRMNPNQAAEYDQSSVEDTITGATSENDSISIHLEEEDTIQSTEVDLTIEEEQLMRQNHYPPNMVNLSNLSDDSKLTDNNRVSKEMMAEMMKASLEASNNISRPFVGLS